MWYSETLGKVKRKSSPVVSEKVKQVEPSDSVLALAGRKDIRGVVESQHRVISCEGVHITFFDGNEGCILVGLTSEDPFPLVRFGPGRRERLETGELNLEGKSAVKSAYFELFNGLITVVKRSWSFPKTFELVKAHLNFFHCACHLVF